jgi:hypothetical protein
MHCLYCKKRLWLFFSKEREFCSKLHEATYHEELSAMNRLMEFTSPSERAALPERRNQTLSEIYRESKINWALSVAVPALCNLVLERPRPKVTPLNPANAVVVDALPFAGSIKFPSSSGRVVAFTLDSVIEPEQISTIANQRTAACRVQSKRRRRIDPPSPAAFSSRTHRRKLR